MAAKRHVTRSVTCPLGWVVPLSCLGCPWLKARVGYLSPLTTGLTGVLLFPGKDLRLVDQTMVVPHSPVNRHTCKNITYHHTSNKKALLRGCKRRTTRGISCPLGGGGGGTPVMSSMPLVTGLTGVLPSPGKDLKLLDQTMVVPLLPCEQTYLWKHNLPSYLICSR